MLSLDSLDSNPSTVVMPENRITKIGVSPLGRSGWVAAGDSAGAETTA